MNQYIKNILIQNKKTEFKIKKNNFHLDLQDLDLELDLRSNEIVLDLQIMVKPGAKVE